MNFSNSICVVENGFYIWVLKISNVQINIFTKYWPPLIVLIEGKGELYLKIQKTCISDNFVLVNTHFVTMDLVSI